MAEDETHLTRTQARGGSSNRVVRYVLGASLILVVIAFAVIIAIWR